MSKLTSKNVKEQALLKHYTPGFLKSIEITPEDAAVYFDWSDRGLGKTEVERRVAEENRTKQFTGLSALYYGKRDRDLAITSYIADWGTTCTGTDFVDEPKEIAEFVSKAIGKPGIMDLWMLHNDPENLTVAQQERLMETMGQFIGRMPSEN